MLSRTELQQKRDLRLYYSYDGKYTLGQVFSIDDRWGREYIVCPIDSIEQIKHKDVIEIAPKISFHALEG